MPIKGEQILKLIMKQLQEYGLKEGSELEPKIIEKAIKGIGFYDQRTIKKYKEAVLESEFVRVEETFKEVKKLRPIEWKELQQRSQNWDQKKADLYATLFMRGLKAIKEQDWNLIDEADIIIEKVSVGKTFFIHHFP